MTSEFTIPGVLERSAGSVPSRPAILSESRSPLSHGELFRHVTEMGGALRAFGVAPTDRIAIVLPNGPEMATVFLSVVSAASAAPLNPSYRESEFDFYLSDLDAKAVIVSAETASPVRAAARARAIPVIELTSDRTVSGLFSLAAEGKVLTGNGSVLGTGADDEALVLHTSGTTSRPKMVPLTHGNLAASCENICRSLALTETDRCLNVMPLFHIHGLMACLLASLNAGASVVCTSGFSSPSFLDQLANFQATWYSAVPTMHQSVLARMKELTAPNGRTGRTAIVNTPALRFIRSSSASLAPSVMEALESAFDVPVIEAYGMTEASHQMASNPLPPAGRKPGSVGLAAGPEVAIMDESGNVLETGARGEIVIRGANVTRGYADHPEANKSAFSEGWFRTGDEGYLDHDGYLFITGRLKEIINRGGEKISPREIDEVLLSHPSVKQVVTFAMPDDKLGEEVAAAVVMIDGSPVHERELQAYAAERLVDFKVPRRIVFVEEIPKGPTGKLRRIGLAEQLGLDGPGPTAGSPAPVQDAATVITETQKAVLSIWKEILKRDVIGLDDEFLDVGGDSILAGRVLLRLDARFHVKLSFVDLFGLTTVRKIAAHIDDIVGLNSAV